MDHTCPPTQHWDPPYTVHINQLSPHTQHCHPPPTVNLGPSTQHWHPPPTVYINHLGPLTQHWHPPPTVHIIHLKTPYSALAFTTHSAHQPHWSTYSALASTAHSELQPPMSPYSVVESTAHNKHQPPWFNYLSPASTIHSAHQPGYSPYSALVWISKQALNALTIGTMIVILGIPFQSCTVGTKNEVQRNFCMWLQNVAIILIIYTLSCTSC